MRESYGQCTNPYLHNHGYRKTAFVDGNGIPDIIIINDIDIPELNDDEMLVNVYTSSVNTVDTSSRKKLVVPSD